MKTTCPRPWSPAIKFASFFGDLNAVAALAAPGENPELWWLFLLAVIALLCGEVWLTRRMAMNR